MHIRHLDPLLVDRIAAGEVVERPAAAVKELVENAIDAGARRIDVTIEAGGKRLIRVVDDGEGMEPADLCLCVERHATSKIPDGDLERIGTLGFRGEALPSIGSVSELEIATRSRGAAQGSLLRVVHGLKSAIMPAAQPFGTRVEVRDLFASTPARLKFLKSDRAEAQAVADVVRRTALANPEIRFSLSGDLAAAFDWPGDPEGRTQGLLRLTQAVGAEFKENSLAVSAEREGVVLRGRAGLPTYHRATAASQFIFVNGRPVRDKALSGALRAAYLDYLPAGRHPAVVLFVDCDPRFVDVNVHPAKAEVRFRDAALVRGLVVGGLRQTIEQAGHRAATTGGGSALAMFQRNQLRASAADPRAWDWRRSPAGLASFGASGAFDASPASLAPSGFQEPAQALFEHVATPTADARAQAEAPREADLDAPLGAARAQLHGTYIVSQTRSGVAIVDQHAAHERLVYEKLKKQRAETGVERQALLVPTIVDLPAPDCDRVLASASALAEAGLVIEPFGPGAVAVMETPALLKSDDISSLLRDIAEGLSEEDGIAEGMIERRIDQVLARIACHHSVRAGRKLTPDEMNALLREMEATPGAGQCNHGRPTYIELALSDIEKLFARR